MKFYYTYALRSKKDKKLYYGYTKNLKLRIEQHNKGLVESTKNRRPLQLIYFEACINRDDAIKREKYFKTHYGRMYIKKRLTNYFNSVNSYSTG
jgi:putative endonuclease